MSWQPNGRYYSFTPEVIRACVPPSSGVYGLFNFNYQLFIGESENIQDALLRHRGDSDLQSRRYRPTGFTFQVCSANLRRRKAEELIEKFRPVRQAALTEPSSPTAGPTVGELPLGELDHSPLVDVEEFSAQERESLPAARPRFYFERTQGVALMALFAVSMAVSFYLGILTGENLQRRAYRESEKTLAWTPMLSPTEQVAVDVSDENFSAKEPIADLSVQIPGWMAGKMATPASGATSDAVMARETPSRSVVDSSVQAALATTAKNSPAVQLAGSGTTSKQWSVQISAAPARNIADALAQRLITAGYDSYVVQAEVKGQTYFRVRVGHFAAQGEAESLRQVLAGNEDYRDAFLALD